MAVILVVDDEEMIRSLVSVVLIAAGHKVLTAVNGLEAIALFRSFSAHIDLVVTDLKMPVMDGYELVRTIRHDRPKARIICMTGYADRDCAQCTTLLLKPFRVEELRETVDQVLAAG